MKRTLIALMLANLALVGCGSDDDNNSTVTPDPGPGPDPEPAETVAIADAQTINVANIVVEEASGVVTFTLATDDEKAITGLGAEGATTSLVFVGLNAPVEWSHISDKLGLATHESQVFGCSTDACTIAIVESGDTKGSYTLTPDGFEWDATPVQVKASISIATETVTVDPIIVDSGA